MISDNQLKISLDGANAYLEYFKIKNTQSVFFTFDFKTKKLISRSSCRELFSNSFTDKNVYIGFACGLMDIQKLNDFFQVVEDRLNLPQNQRTVFFRCDKSYIVICQVPTFWRKNILRRQLFTFFLRAGGVYGKEGYNGALKKYQLAQGMRTFINQFFKGLTFQKLTSNIKIAGSFGIVYHFKGKKVDYLKLHLKSRE